MVGLLELPGLSSCQRSASLDPVGHGKVSTAGALIIRNRVWGPIILYNCNKEPQNGIGNY